ncbi:butyrophilin-like protein 2 [Mesocricetus auratus]|uniref:Butyrophilin-like protein 2 n=1 Tax=Mesocricetus auratus TaxID=10036 RepID=A0ABM2WBZ9_MESAU|nr:butyrophilin-like protein 2 [Mesocricetus auratus]
MVNGPGYSLSGVAASLLFILLTMKHPDDFRVVGPALPILAKVGEDALLTCRLLPQRAAAHMEVRWYRSDPDSPVLVHREGAEVAGLQAEGYRGRVEQTEDSAADEGSVALKIRQIQPGDDGQYWCRFQEGDYWREASVRLQVTALGSSPNIHVEGPGEGEVQLVCTSQGWFPEPEVFWEGSWGEKLSSFSENHVLGEDGLFYVEDTLVVRNDTSETISCSIYNRGLKEAKEATIALPEKLQTELATSRVIGPSRPILVRLGENIELTCHLSPQADAQSMEVRWVRSHYYSTVHVYVDGARSAGEQMAEYRGRTVVMSDTIHQGRLTLRIQDARTSDDGQYRCLFGKDGVYQEALVDVQVMAVGSTPRITREVLKNGGAQLRCVSEGWFPRPHVQWRDMAGRAAPSLSETFHQGSQGLFQVETLLLVTNSSLVNVTCSVSLPGGEEKVAHLPLSDSRIALLWMALPVLLLPLAMAFDLIKEKHSSKDQKHHNNQQNLKNDENQASLWSNPALAKRWRHLLLSKKGRDPFLRLAVQMVARARLQIAEDPRSSQEPTAQSQRWPCPCPVEMKGCPTSPPAGCLLPLLLLASTGASGEVSSFSVRGPDDPIRVLLGTDVTLPCQLSPAQSASHMHIRWYRAQLTPAVLVFHDGQEQVQMPEYQGRTRLVRDAIDTGSVALQIRQVQASDDGLYHCQVTHGATSQEVTIELRVTGLGSAPLVRMTGPENNGIRVSCSSSGWFPKPRVRWRDGAGEALPSSSEAQTQDGDGLFHVEASLLVTDRTAGKVACSIQNPLHDQEEVRAIMLPEPFFPRTSPWKVALFCLLPVLLVLFAGTSLAAWKQHQAKKQEKKEKSEAEQETQQMRKEKETALKKRDDLQAELDRRKALYKEDWKKALLYPDWRKELFQLAPVRINHEMPHQDKSSPEAEESSREETAQPLLSHPRDDHNIITLYQEGFMLGRYYWEVCVGDTEEWTLGVYELSNQDAPSREPLRKFRVLEKKGDEYRALTFCSQTVSLEEPLLLGTRPWKIAIFLDQEDNDLSFYNMTDETHIFSFTQARFLGSLYPYFTHNPADLSPSHSPK